MAARRHADRGRDEQERTRSTLADVGRSIAFRVTATNDAGPVSVTSAAVTPNAEASTDGTVGGTVPATLALTLGAPATFSAFTPGVDREYTATTKATVLSTAGDAALSVSDPGHLTQRRVLAARAAAVAFSKSAWTGPVSNEDVTVTFKQHIGANDALRTGTYSRTLTFTLSTTTP